MVKSNEWYDKIKYDRYSATRYFRISSKWNKELDNIDISRICISININKIQSPF